MEYSEFVTVLAERLRGLPGVEGIEQQPDGELTLTLAGGTTGHLNPRNAYRAVQTGEPLDHVIAVQTQVITAMNEAGGELAPWAEATPRITARLERPDLARQHERCARPWAASPELWEIVVEDFPTHMRGVLRVDAEVWGQTEAGLFALGLANLRRLVERGPRPRQAAARLWLMVATDGYGASRLLLPGWLLSHLPTRRASYGWLCMAPARDVLALTPLSGEPMDFAQIAEFAAAVRGLGRMSHPWPFAPLILADGAVRPLAGPARAA